MSYENAPATYMLDSRCAICSRPLLDAASVEIGIGPVCREKRGYAAVEGLDEATRKRANEAIARVAANWQDDELRRLEVATLHLIGLERLAHQILHKGRDPKRRGKGGGAVAVDRWTSPEWRGRYKTLPAVEGYLVRAPYDETGVERLRALRGSRWVREEKAWFVPALRREQLWVVLRAVYAGRELTVDGAPRGEIRAGTP